jgi:hypothetical protein
MQKIATPQDLQVELQRLLAYCQEPHPSRDRLASELRGLAAKLAAASVTYEITLGLKSDDVKLNMLDEKVAATFASRRDFPEVKSVRVKRK